MTPENKILDKNSKFSLSQPTMVAAKKLITIWELCPQENSEYGPDYVGSLAGITPPTLRHNLNNQNFVTS